MGRGWYRLWALGYSSRTDLGGCVPAFMLASTGEMGIASYMCRGKKAKKYRWKGGGVRGMRGEGDLW